MEKYDVIVVGAGYGGMIAAETAAKNGSKTLLLEKSRELGEPATDTGAVHIGAIKHFDIDDDVILNPFYGVRFYTPNGEYATIDAETEIGFMVERKLFFKSLAKRAIDSGVEIKVGHRATDVISEDGAVRGVVTQKDGKENKFQSNITIAADGTNSVIVRKSNIAKPGEFLICREFELFGAKMDTERYMQIFLGNEFAPGHAAWIYPVTKSHIFFGTAILESKAKGTIHDYVAQSWNTKMIAEKLNNAKCTEEHIGFIPTTGPLERTYGDGIMVIGDAAGQTDPVASEGIRYAMICGEMAGKTASEAVSQEDFGKDFLKRYETEWKEEFGQNFEYPIAARKILNRSSDSMMNLIMKPLRENESILNGFKNVLKSGKYPKGPLPFLGDRVKF